MATHTLSDRTASDLLRLIRTRPGGASRNAGNVAALPRLIRCTSSTPIGGTAVLDQCYPAVALIPAADTPAPPEEGVDCLLMVLDSEGEAGVPIGGGVYLAVLTSEVMADVVGSGPSAIGRSLFIASVPQPAANAGIEWLVALRPGDCITLTVPDVGALPLTATDRATWVTEEFELCGAPYIAVLDKNEKTLTLNSTDVTSGAAVSFVSDLRGGCNFALAGFSRYDLCPCADPLPGGPCANVVRLRIEWAPCFTQAFDVETPCCPDVLLPRVLCVRGNPAQGLGGIGVTGAYIWNPDALPLGAWQRESVDYSGNPYTLDLRCTDIGVGSPELIWLLTTDGIIGAEIGTPNNFAVGRKPVEELPCPESGEDFSITLDVPGPTWAPIPDNWTVTAWTEVGCAQSLGVTGYNGPGWYVTEAGIEELDDETACDPRTVILCGPYETEEEAEAAAESELCGGDGEIEPCEGEGELLDGYAGPGWYCVRDAGTEDACEALYLANEDRCDDTIEICSGPYLSEEAAVAGCLGGSGSDYGAPYDCPDEFDGFTTDGFYCVRIYGTTENASIAYMTAADCGGWEIISGPHDPASSAPCFGSSGGGGGPATGAENYTIALPGGGSATVHRMAPRRWQGSGYLLTAQTGGSAWLLSGPPGCRWRANSWSGTGCTNFTPLNSETGCTGTLNVCAG